MFVTTTHSVYRTRWRWLLAVLTLIALDQASKTYFSQTIPINAAIEITPWLNFVHILNTGAAFSFLANADGWQRGFLTVVGVLIVVPVAVMSLLRHTPNVERWVGAAIVAGGCGNLIDRIRTGAVVDFVDLHWGSLHWPAFNLADVFIVSAVLAWLPAAFAKPDPAGNGVVE
ncbi:MAG: signal peptidase II [Rhodoferax sp.]|nr:MAG: signal peptidase II [Rhodoferax sp.]